MSPLVRHLAKPRRQTSSARGRRLVALAASGILAACGATATATSGATSTTTASPPPTTSGSGSVSRYADAVDAAHRHGLRVWLEADLVKRWRQGAASLAAALDQLAVLARHPGVVGIKIADELDYRDGLGNDPHTVLEFLHDAAAGIHSRMPGMPILVDIVVPPLGCAPGISAVATASAQCTAAAEQRHPALTLDAVDTYLASGDVDVVDVSTSLFTDDQYRAWGIDRDTAQRAAWQEIVRRGWMQHVTVDARKALAHPGTYQGGATQAETDLRTFVDIPRSAGAAAVDIWAWRQTYKGQVVRLLDPGLQDNALWDGLRQRHDAGVRLFTHVTPSSLEVGLDTDLGVLSQAFTDVFLAAGTG